MQDLNQILNIPENEVKIIKLLGQGARSNVYQVEKDDHQYAIKFLVKRTKQNEALLNKEYETIQQLYNMQMNQQTFNALQQFVPIKYTLEEINEKIIKQIIPQAFRYNSQRHYYFMPVYSKIQIKEINEEEADDLKHQLFVHYFLLRQINILHNDYSPYNIMKNEDNNFVIIDYEESQSVGSAPLYPGSARYSLKQPNNLFSIGIILYEISGSLPWHDERWPENIHKIQEETLKDVEKYYPSSDKLIRKLIKMKDQDISINH